MPDMGAVMAEIHEAIQKQRTVGDRQHGEFTANEYAEDRGMAASTARHELLAAERMGLVSSRKSRVRANLKYYKKEEEGSNE